MKKDLDNEFKNILVIRDDRIGDLVLSVPAAENLKLNYPNAKVTFLVAENCKTLVTGNPYIDKVITYKKDDCKTFKDFFKFVMSLRRNKFDAAFVLHPTQRMHMAVFFAGIPIRVGWDIKYGFLLNYKYPHLKHLGEKHEAEYNLQLLSLFGLSTKDPTPIIPFDYINTYYNLPYENLGIKPPVKYVVFGIGASCLSKQWSVSNYVRLAELINVEYTKNPIALIGNAAEQKLSGAFSEVYASESLDLVGKLALEQTILFLKKNALCYIGNDSGMGHIAAALGLPTVIIFGRSDPGLAPHRWRPIGEKVGYLHNPPECSECLAHNCQKNYKCLEQVIPNDVFACVKNMLNSSAVSE